MGNAQESKNRYSFEEYLKLEETSEVRHDYLNGEVFAMAGGTMNHNTTVLNIAFALRSQSRGKGCHVFTENVKLELIQQKFYVYPDVLLTCNSLDFADNLIVRYPELIVEVLSDSTEAYDLGTKLDYYLKISSLKYYLIISQKTYLVRLYERTADGWRYASYEGIDQVIQLELLAVNLPLTTIYEEIQIDNSFLFQ